MKKNIVILDSGIGGLSVFKMLYKELPMFNYVYYADTKNLPYGKKTKKQLINITINNLKEIIKDYNPILIIFGCNTIGITIFEYLQKKFINIKMFALTPNIKNALQHNYKNILLLGTNKTIEGIRETSVYKRNSSCIILCKMPLLATKVENNIENIKKTVPYLKRQLKKYYYADCIILGCSHYYFVKNEINSMFKKVKIIDGVKNVVKAVKKYVVANNYFSVLPNKKNSKVKLVITGNKTTIETYNKIIQNIIKKNKSG